MTEESTSKYLLGTCYTCQKCLYCFKLPQKNLCKCKKDKQPARISNPKRGQQIYQRVFTPNQSLQLANEFLFTANTKFDYISNFQEKFSYTFCTSCNSKFQRLRNKERSNNKKDQIYQTGIELDKDELNEDNEHNSEEENNDGEGDGCELESISKGDINEEEDDSKESDSEEGVSVEEVKVQIVIKNKDKKMPTAKTLTIQPISYINFIGRINSMVQKALEKNVKSTCYTMSYKVINVRGPSHELEDELDFQEFLDEYKRVISMEKKMSIVIIIKDNVMKKKSSKKYSKVKYFFFMSIVKWV